MAGSTQGEGARLLTANEVGSIPTRPATVKVCIKCGQEKALDGFYRRGKKHQGTCKTCVLAYQRHLYATSEKRRGDINRANAEVIQRNREAVYAYLAEHPCVDCGEKDTVVLEFDHRDDAPKTDTISAMVRRAFSLTTIMKEISKCDVRCANCHRRRTAIQFGWWKPQHEDA